MRWTCWNVTRELLGERNWTYRKNAVTLVPFTVHLEVAVTHLLNLLYDERRLHEPCQHGVQAEDHLRVFRHSAQRSYK